MRIYSRGKNRTMHEHSSRQAKCGDVVVPRENKIGILRAGYHATMTSGHGISLLLYIQPD